MEEFRSSLINEIEKMYKKKKATVIVIISILIIILGQIIVFGVRNGLGLRGVSGLEFPILVLSVFVNTILPLFTTLVTIDIFTGEFSQNTMKITFIRPVSRFKVFLSKIVAILFFIFINLLAVMILSTVFGVIFNATSITIVGLWRVFISYLVTLIPAITLAMVIVLFANMFRSSTSVFFLSIIMFLVLKVLGVVFSEYSSFIITSSLNWYNYWIADSLPIFKIVRQLLIMVGYDIMLFAASYHLFDTKEL